VNQERIDKALEKLKEQLPELIKKDTVKYKGNSLEQANFIEHLPDGSLYLTTEGVNKAKELLAKNNLTVNLIANSTENGKITYSFTIVQNAKIEPKNETVKLGILRPFLHNQISKIENRMGKYMILFEFPVSEKPEIEKRSSELDSWELILLIDTREVKTKKDRSFLYEQLMKNRINCEKRALPLGDALWIYRHNGPNMKKPKEYVLDHIIERKKADDLASSIIDGRYVEQKHRLQECGIPNVIYIIEGDPTSGCAVPELALRTAVNHTKTMSGFKVFRAKSIEDTLMWLSMWTEKIKKYVNRDYAQEKCMTYKEFCTGSSKGGNMTIQKCLSKQLSVVFLWENEY